MVLIRARANSIRLTHLDGLISSAIQTLKPLYTNSRSLTLTLL